MSLRGMAALVAGLGGGFERGQEARRQEARQDANDAWVNEQRGRQRTDWNDQDAVKAAAAPVQATDGEVYQPAVDDEGNAMPTNPTAGTGMLGAVRYPTRADATAAAAQQNTPAATAERQAKVLLGQGRVADAVNHQKVAQQLKDEGHMDFIKTNFANAPTVDQIRSGNDTFDLGGVDAFNAAGGGTIPAGARGKAFLTKTPDGREVVDYTVVDGATGKPIAPSARQFESYFGMNFKEREAAARDDAKFASDATYKTGMLGVAQRGASTAEKNANTQEAYRRDSVEARREATQARIDIADGKVAAGGAGRRADHFDEKEWSSASKIEPSFVSFDGEDGKAKESPELRLVYTGRLNALRSQGDMAPNEAAEAARTTTLKLKNAATERVEAARKSDAKSTLTEAQAVKQIIKEFQSASTKGPAAAPGPQVAPAPSVPSGMNTIVPAAQTAAAPAAAEPSLLNRIAASPIVRRMSDLGTDYTSEQGKALLQRRVVEATKGGPALTDTEALRARQAGLI